MLEKNLVTRKAKVQLNDVDIEEAKDLTSDEKSSDIMSQGMGPNPILNTDTNTDREITGSMSIFSAKSGLSSLM